MLHTLLTVFSLKISRGLFHHTTLSVTVPLDSTNYSQNWYLSSDKHLTRFSWMPGYFSWGVREANLW